MPIIEKKCATPDCHGINTPPGMPDMSRGMELVFHRKGRRGGAINAALFNRAYESLLESYPNAPLIGRYVLPSSARHSPLIWRLYGKPLGQTDARAPYVWPDNHQPHEGFLTDAEKKLFVEWVDLGAQWDNLPGEDDLPGYDADESRKLAQEAAEALKEPIADPRQAFEARCSECHDFGYIERASKPDTNAWLQTVARMAEKRPDWIHDGERWPIVGYIRAAYPAKRP
jgi:hypothetical protein